MRFFCDFKRKHPFNFRKKNDIVKIIEKGRLGKTTMKKWIMVILIITTITFGAYATKAKFELDKTMAYSELVNVFNASDNELKISSLDYLLNNFENYNEKIKKANEKEMEKAFEEFTKENLIVTGAINDSILSIEKTRKEVKKTKTREELRPLKEKMIEYLEAEKSYYEKMLILVQNEDILKMDELKNKWLDDFYILQQKTFELEEEKEKVKETD